jgi:hypothetical protein
MDDGPLMINHFLVGVMLADVIFMAFIGNGEVSRIPKLSGGLWIRRTSLSKNFYPKKIFSRLVTLTILYAIAYCIKQIVNSICNCMLNYAKQFGRLPSLAAFYYGVWPRGLGIIFHDRANSGEYFPQCLSQKFTILETNRHGFRCPFISDRCYL